MSQNKEIADFYDDFVSSQTAKGINDRIYALYCKTVELGLKHNSSVVELGCGIGALTFLLSKHARYIEASDISEKSIAFAKQHAGNRNIRFTVQDAVTYIPELTKPFDFVLMYDMLEHIPLDRHHRLFSNIVTCMHEESLLLINIPNPLYIEYDQKHNAGTLQVIDQPIYLDRLAQVIYQNGLVIHQFGMHSVSVQDDYQFLVVKKRKEFEEIFLSRHRNIMQRIIFRLQLFYRRLRYPYP